MATPKTPTVKAILDTRYEKTGNVYPVKLRVTYDRKQKYYGTKHSMTEGNWNIMNGIPDRHGKRQELCIGRKAAAGLSLTLLFVFPPRVSGKLQGETTCLR